MLAKNTDKLNEVFAEILRRSGTNALEEAKADTALFIAEGIVNFSTLIVQFPLGDKASNIEIAITGDEIALTVLTRTTLPQAWAMTQDNLASAYKERIKGNRAQNIEQAIFA